MRGFLSAAIMLLSILWFVRVFLMATKPASQDFNRIEVHNPKESTAYSILTRAINSGDPELASRSARVLANLKRKGRVRATPLLGYAQAGASSTGSSTVSLDNANSVITLPLAGATSRNQKPADRNKGWLIWGHVVMSGSWQRPPVCSAGDEPPAIQGECSAPSLLEAKRACMADARCVGLHCSSYRTDCQLRYWPMRIEYQQPDSTSFIKPGACVVCKPLLDVPCECGDGFRCETNQDEIQMCEACVTWRCVPEVLPVPQGQCGQELHCVISYGLYGSNPKYTVGALENVKLAPRIFPGWTVRIYHDHTASPRMLHKIAKFDHVELVHVHMQAHPTAPASNGSDPATAPATIQYPDGEVEVDAEAEPRRAAEYHLAMTDTEGGGAIAGMFWRFLVADDPGVDRYLVRDADSRLNWREKAAVDEWVLSGKAFHSIRDHPNHERPLNGGMWGGVKGAFAFGASMTKLVSNFVDKELYGADLDFLSHKVWPRVMDNQIAHDSFSCHKYPNSHPFPTRRLNYQHVGQVFEADNLPREQDIRCCLLDRVTPIQCRGDPRWLLG